MKILRTPIVLLALSICLTAAAYRRLAGFEDGLSAEQRRQHEVLYLPRGAALQFMSFGYRGFLADILWFNAISYFGKHYAGDKNYQWLSHMCDLVSTLDGRRKHVYDFCSMMLAWEAGLPGEALKILNRASDNFPDYWRFYYLRGFIYLYFLKDAAPAQKEFLRASRLPDAHPVVIRMAAKQLADEYDTDTAIEFLQEMIKNSTNNYQRRALKTRLKKMIQLKRQSGGAHESKPQ